MKIRSYKIINLYHKMEKSAKDNWLSNFIKNEVEVGETVIVHYIPEKPNNFDKGCIYVFNKMLFTYKCIALEDISPMFNMEHKLAKEVINKFKAKYSVKRVVKTSWR